MDKIQFLSHAEVCELTGARTKAGQIRILKRNGIPHTIKASGWPCVISANLLPSAQPEQAQPMWKPRKAG